jgi:YfiH family protein
MTIELIRPDWPAPVNVQAVSTTRLGGHSLGVYESLNLGLHVGDDESTVLANRQSLARQLALPTAPHWLQQVHGVELVELGVVDAAVEADGSFSRRAGQVCVVMTADCLPVLLCDQAGSVVAAVHAGWRGLAEGILEQAVTSMAVPGEQLMAWLGPAIGPTAFEVGAEVREQFVHVDAQAESAFIAGCGDRYFADIYALARQRLAAAGVGQIYGGEHCTHTDSARFFSYRRDGQCGRMASLIWLDKTG